MGTPAGCEQGNRGWRKDPMGPWTLAAHGGRTFERLSISFSFVFVFFCSCLQPPPHWLRDLAAVMALLRRGGG